MRKKKIKTFSVDESVYDELMGLFRDSNAEVSLSYFVDKSLKELLEYLRVIEDMKKGDIQYTVPMSYIIDNVVRSKHMTSIEVRGSDETSEEVEYEIKEWQNRYEAEKKNIPYKFYGFVKSGQFTLSKDKKYVLNIKTGRKYSVTDDGFVFDLKDEEEQGQA